MLSFSDAGTIILRLQFFAICIVTTTDLSFNSATNAITASNYPHQTTKSQDNLMMSY